MKLQIAEPAEISEPEEMTVFVAISRLSYLLI